ncbi:hypothetical protein CGSSp11BS70_10625 [Streptococcus pneumoniae SP11-BS70]|nr:hypothetical protein CGSSp11BS70_10625 [Streptococcus pneumoniae SP11-BS70]
MAGEAPSATNPFAVKFFTTSLVIQMTNGAFFLIILNLSY